MFAVARSGEEGHSLLTRGGVAGDSISDIFDEARGTLTL